MLRRWMCLCVAKLCERYDEAAMQAIREGVPDKLRMLLKDPVPEVPIF